MDPRPTPSDNPSLPFERSYWVDPGRLIAGFLPASEDPAEMDHKCASLVDSGVRLIINLMEEDERNGHGAPFASYEPSVAAAAAATACEVRCERFGIRDLGVPDRATMQRILDTIDASLSAGQPVYVHCWGGKGRTGTVVGCWLLRHGLATRDNVFDRIKELRAHIPNGGSSPETEEQRAFVREWGLVRIEDLG